MKRELEIIFWGSKRAADVAGGRRGRDLGYGEVYARNLLNSTIMKSCQIYKIENNVLFDIPVLKLNLIRN